MASPDLLQAQPPVMSLACARIYLPKLVSGTVDHCHRPAPRLCTGVLLFPRYKQPVMPEIQTFPRFVLASVGCLELVLVSCTSIHLVELVSAAVVLCVGRGIKSPPLHFFFCIL